MQSLGFFGELAFWLGESNMSESTSRWCHVTVTTYANWLPGDPRGFRTWKHREHVEGDYRRPPDFDYSERHAASRKKLRAVPTDLTPNLRRIVALAFGERLSHDGIEVVIVSVSGCHGHVLAKFPPGDGRLPTGAAKKHAWYRLREIGWSGRLWAKRCGVNPIQGRAHQMNAYGYILRHESEGAFVWAWHRDRKDVSW